MHTSRGIYVNATQKWRCLFPRQTAGLSFTNLPPTEPNETVNCKSDVMYFKNPKISNRFKHSLFVYSKAACTRGRPKSGNRLLSLSPSCLSSAIAESNQRFLWLQALHPGVFWKRSNRWVAKPWVLPGCEHVQYNLVSFLKTVFWSIWLRTWDLECSSV